MIESLFNKEAYKIEFENLKAKAASRPGLLDRHYVNQGVTLRWVLYNQDLVIKEIIGQLKDKTYKTPIAVERKVLIEEKERLLYYFDWHERALQGVVSRVLNEALETKFSDSLNSYRKGRGAFNTLGQISQYLSSLDYSSDVFVIKKDIKSYGDNIIHEKLFEILPSKVDMDDYFFEVVKKMIQFEYKRYPDGELVTKSIGLPTGSPINNVIANVFLMDLDEKIEQFKDRSCYFRYGDDICVATPSKAVVEEVSGILDSFVSNAGLTFNNKGGLFTFDKTKNQQESFKYLGLMLKPNGLMSLTPQKEDEIKKEMDRLIIKIKTMTSGLTKNKTQKVDTIIRSSRSLFTKTKLYNFLCMYLPVVNDEEYWEKIDHWIAKRILYLVYDNNNDSVFSKYPFSEMRKKGLISFRHMRRIILSGDRVKLNKYLES